MKGCTNAEEWTPSSSSRMRSRLNADSIRASAQSAEAQRVECVLHSSRCRYLHDVSRLFCRREP